LVPNPQALDTFNTALVTPIYYVLFTTCVIIASAILFREFSHFQLKDWVGVISGFSVVLSAIVLLHFCKNYDITLEKLAQQIKVTQEEAENDSLDFEEVPNLPASDSEAEAEDRERMQRSSYGALSHSASV
jgi:hypothetical protein